MKKTDYRKPGNKDRKDRDHSKDRRPPRRDFREGGKYRDEKNRDGKSRSGEKKGHHKPFHGNPRGHARERFKGKATLWGIHAVTAAWQNPARAIKTLYITEEALKEFQGVLNTPGRPQPTVVTRRDIDDILPQGAVHQGIAVDAAALDEVFVQDLIIRAGHKPRSVIVILDQVTDPHNVGAIMRSACAFGADGIVMQSRHSPEINGVLVKAASGAAEHIAVAYETNLSRAINHLQEAGYTAVALDEGGDSDMAGYAFPPKTALVLGAEGKGLRQGVRENCDVILRLPTGGPIGTLNVSNAAAVSLYAFAANAKA